MNLWLYPFTAMTPKLRAKLPRTKDLDWACTNTTQWYLLGKGHTVGALLGIAPEGLMGNTAWLWGHNFHTLTYSLSEFKAARKLIRLLTNASPYNLRAFTDDSNPMFGHFGRWLGWQETSKQAGRTFYEVI